MLGAPPAGRTSTPSPSADELMDWAERRYAVHFPARSVTRAEGPFRYRHYTSTGNYIGVADGFVYVLGPLSDGQLVRVGSLTDFAPLVYATRYADSGEAAARFLLQATFSATDEEIAEVRRLGYEAWIDAQFTLPIGETAWHWLEAHGYAAVDRNEYYFGGHWAFDFAAYKQFFTAPDALRKRLQLAWTELFAVSLRTTTLGWACFAYATFWDMLGEQTFGNYRDLLERVTVNAAMGHALNSDGNEKENPATGGFRTRTTPAS